MPAISCQNVIFWDVCLTVHDEVCWHSMLQTACRNFTNCGAAGYKDEKMNWLHFVVRGKGHSKIFHEGMRIDGLPSKII